MLYWTEFFSTSLYHFVFKGFTTPEARTPGRNTLYAKANSWRAPTISLTEWENSIRSTTLSKTRQRFAWPTVKIKSTTCLSLPRTTLTKRPSRREKSFVCSSGNSSCKCTTHAEKPIRRLLIYHTPHGSPLKCPKPMQYRKSSGRITRPRNSSSYNVFFKIKRCTCNHKICINFCSLCQLCRTNYMTLNFKRP